MLLYKKMIKEKTRVLREIEQVKHQIAILPKGTFYYVKQQKHIKWFTHNGQKRIYIPKKRRNLAEQLAQRKYLTQKQKDLEAELMSIQAYLDNYAVPQADRVLEDAEYQKLILPAQQEQQWANAPYPQNPKYPEHKIHQVQGDLWVRSKSEAMIATRLQAYKISFRYECALELSNATYYPDFTLRHPKTGEIYYWEHLGLLAQDTYKNNIANKLQNYIYDDIIPGVQLIVTAETNQQPLSPAIIDKTILKYFI
ncbi:MAG: ATPase [Clostridia bacterium]|nr:ATPase [Clostridia bacterium]